MFYNVFKIVHSTIHCQRNKHSCKIDCFETRSKEQLQNWLF